MNKIEYEARRPKVGRISLNSFSLLLLLSAHIPCEKDIVPVTFSISCTPSSSSSSSSFSLIFNTSGRFPMLMSYFFGPYILYVYAEHIGSAQEENGYDFTM